MCCLCAANKQFVPSNNHSQQCTNWETFGHHHLLWTPIPKNYPSEFNTEEELYLSPKKLTYDMLKVGVMSSHANYVNGNWGIDTVKQFLYSLSINNEAIHGILNHAQNACAVKLLENEPNDSEHLQILSRHHDEHPSLYECWPFPATWMLMCPYTCCF